MSHDDAGIDRKVLSHDAWPGYDRAFNYIFMAALIYLGLVYAIVGSDYVDHHAAAGHGDQPAHGAASPDDHPAGTTPPPGHGPKTDH